MQLSSAAESETSERAGQNTRVAESTKERFGVSACCSMLQWIAVCCNALPCVAVCSGVL